MSDFIREVNEEVRQERIRLFLERYWGWLVAVLVLVLAGVGAWKTYEYVTTQKAQGLSGRYLAAVDEANAGKGAEADAALAGIAQDGTPGYRLLARFRLAADQGRGDPAAGAKAFDGLAADPAVDPALQNLARLRAALLLVDTAPFAELKNRLDPLADANNSLRGPARELLALAALKAGRGEDATRALSAIGADPTSPGPLRQRAQALLGLVRSGNGDQSAEAPPAAQPAPATVQPAPLAPVPPVTTEPAPAAPAIDPAPAPTLDGSPPAAAAPK